MPRILRRTKVVSIRLSNQEYEEFLGLCATRGTDSISELARTGLRMLANSEKSSGPGAIETRVEIIDTRVSQLDREVGHLYSVMGVSRLEGNNEKR